MSNILLSKFNFLKFFSSSIIFTLLVFVNFPLLGQQTNEPLVCQNPTKELGIDYISGGAFDINKYSCLTSTTGIATHVVSSPSGILPGSETYFFNFKDDSNLLQLSTNKKQAFFLPGKYWVLQQGKIGSKNAISCNSIEVIQTLIPDVEVITCGKNNYAIKFSNTSNNQTYSEYVIDWGDGTKETLAITPLMLPFTTKYHNFASKPKQLPVVIGNYKRNNAIICTTIAKSSLPITTDNTYISTLVGVNLDGTAKLILTNEIKDANYTIQFKVKGDSIWSNTLDKPLFKDNKAEIVVRNLRFNSEYCFRVLVQSSDCNDKYVSDEVCSINVKANLESSSSVKLNWNVANSNTPFNVNIRDSNNNNYPVYTTSVNEFFYNSINCSYKYAFTISYSYTQDSKLVTVISGEITVNPNEINSKLPPILTGTVDIKGQNILIQPSVVSNISFSEYTFFRMDNNNRLIEIGKSTTNTFIDTQVEPQKKQYCYQVQYTDICGLKSTMSPVFCSTLLENPTINKLSWSEIEVSEPSKYNNVEKRYQIMLVDKNGDSKSIYQTDLLTLNYLDIPEISNELLNTGFANFFINASQILTIEPFSQLEFTQNSNIITVYFPLQIHTPTAFTPNGQGPLENEEFIVKGSFIYEFQIYIYNSWGNIIFESNDINDSWDGMLPDNSASPTGMYTYKIICKDIFGRQLNKNGQIYLLR